MNLMNILNKIINFCKLKKVFDSATGIYFDGSTIYGVNLKLSKDEFGKTQWKIANTTEVLFITSETTTEEPVQPKNIYELLAEKVYTMCATHNWNTKTIALCLNINDVVIDVEDFSVLPADKIENAVKYQIAAAGEFEIDTFLSSYMKIDDQIWMEGILKTEVSKWTNAWSKNGMNLLGLTAMPDLINKSDDIDEANEHKALFAANILANRTIPNFLIDETTDLIGWNLGRIITAIIILITFGSIIVLGLDIWQLHEAQSDLEYEKTQLKLLEKDRYKEEFIAKGLKEVEDKNQILANLSKQSFPWRSLLIHFGTIKVHGVWLKEIHNTDDKIVEIKGEAMNFEAMANYVKILENDKIFNIKKPTMKYSELQRESGLIQFIIDIPIS